MSEQFLPDQLHDQLDEAINAIIAGGEADAFTPAEQILTDLAMLGAELRNLPRESFKSQLREELKRSAAMTTTGTKTKESLKHIPAGDQSITPYLTVKRAEQL